MSTIIISLSTASSPKSQIYRFSGDDNLDSGGRGLQEAFSVGLGESVRSMEGGRVSTDTHPEVVVCTFRGRVCSLTTQALGQVMICVGLGFLVVVD